MSGGSTTSSGFEIQASSDSSFSDPTFSNVDSENVEFCLRLQDGSGKIARYVSRSKFICFLLLIIIIIRYGDVVWGMQDGFPWWPVLLCDPKIMDDLTEGAAESRSKSKEKSLLVFFFSTCEWAFIRPRMVSHWHKDYHSRCEGCFVRPQDTDGSKKKRPKRVGLTKSVSRAFFSVSHVTIYQTPHTHTHTHTHTHSYNRAWRMLLRMQRHPSIGM